MVVFPAMFIMVLILAWTEIWSVRKELRQAQAKVEALEADKGELLGTIEDLKEFPVEYFMLYRRATIARFERIEPRWDRIMEAAWRSSKKNGVPAEITIAKIEHESGFNPEAIGMKGELGLMQIYPPAWPQFNTARGFEIEYNIDFGCGVFAGCMKQANGDIREALRLYNGKGELPPGVIPYSDRVLNGRSMKVKEMKK